MFTPRRLAVTVWAMWLSLLVVLAGLLSLRVWHPHYLAVTPLLILFAVCATALIGRSLWQLARGRRRVSSLAWLLIGVAPLWFLAGHIVYGLQTAYGRSVHLSYPLKVLAPLAESLMDLEARFRHPHRTVGEKVVMISQPVADAPDQVAAMDEHIRQLEKRLGRQLESRVHWVRGPLLGMQGKAIVGLCMGTRPEEAVPDQQGLDPMDRHEVAHCVISMLCPPSSEPPALLIEGWAEANSGHDALWLADRARESRHRGQTLPLQELTGPAWAGSHTKPVYVQGGPLVNYLLEEFGAERFFRLYTTCRRATFVADCQRCLGADLVDLEHDYWADIERLVQRAGPPSRRQLARLTLGPAVDGAAWQKFLDDYFAAVPRWLATYDFCERTVEVENQQVDENGRICTNPVGYKSTRSGAWRSLVIEGTKSDHRVIVASPKHPFTATRESAQEPWVVRRAGDINEEQTYRLLRHEIDSLEFLGELSVLCSESLKGLADASDLVVTRLERFREGDTPLVRLQLEDRSRRRLPLWRAASFVLADDGSFALRSSDYDAPRPDGIVRREVTYDHRNGNPVVRSVTTTRRHRDGKMSTCVERVVTCRFGPTPQEAFSAERLLGPGFVEGPPLRSPHDTVAAFGTDWSRWFLGGGALLLVTGLGLLGWKRRTATGSRSGAVQLAHGLDEHHSSNADPRE